MSFDQTALADAPKDRHILVLCRCWHYGRGGWYAQGSHWVEAWWYEPPFADGKGPRWMIWCGTSRITTTEDVDPIRWTELPE